MEDVTKEMIAEWKKKHGKVFQLSFPNGPIYYKRLGREDYVEIQDQAVQGIIKDHELEACKRCVLNEIPEDRLLSEGGTVTVLYEQLMRDSGFLVIESVEL
jgi:hypothetical protein